MLYEDEAASHNSAQLFYIEGIYLEYLFVDENIQLKTVGIHLQC